MIAAPSGERLADHALRAGLQALLAENDAGALMIAAAPACIALLRQSEDAADQEPQRLRRHTVAVSGRIRNGCPYGQPWKRGDIYLLARDLAHGRHSRSSTIYAY